MPVVKYWRDGTVRDAAPGIAIVAEQPEFADYLLAGGHLQDMYNFAFFTANCLKYIAATNAGRTVLRALADNAVRIFYHPLHNMVVTGNDQASLNLVAKEIIYDGRPGPATRAAVSRMSVFRFLDEFRQQPTWDIVANGGAIGAAGLRIDDSALRAWIDSGTVPVGLGQAGLDQLRLATISSLDRVAARGPGCASSIGFCIGKDNEDNQQRPPTIALAHELIHAYFSFTGCQCGRLGGDYTLPLFEFKCVGLGRPWVAAPVSENAVRAQWANVAVPVADVLNRRAVAPRAVYD